MKKYLVLSMIIISTNTMIGCGNKYSQRDNFLMKYYISSVNSNQRNFNINNIENDLQKYKVSDEIYSIVNSSNNEISDNIRLISFEDSKSKFDLEFVNNNNINLSYFPNDNESLFNSVTVNKTKGSNNMSEVNFKTIKNRNQFLNATKDLNIISNNFGYYTDIEGKINSNEVFTIKDIESKFSINFESFSDEDNYDKYIYSDKDEHIKLFYNKKLEKFSNVEYTYKDTTIYYNQYNSPYMDTLSKDIGIQLIEKATPYIHNILDDNTI